MRTPEPLPPELYEAGHLLNVEQAAARLGISPGTLRNWVASRQIDHVRVGRLTKFTRAQLDKYAHEHTVAAGRRAR